MTKTKKSAFLEFLKKHRHKFLVVFFIFLFLITFVISVSGGLRVFFPYLGDLTGFPVGQKNYLVIFQNNNELRPGGGFISSFAKLQLTAGVPTQLQIEDVYGTIDDHAYQTPPWPMEKLLANEWYKGYSFRDGNYSPNFPSSAQELIRLYHLTRPNEKLDGIIALNYQTLEDLMNALGPLEVEGRWLNQDNLFEEITASVNDIDRHNLESLANRKSILKPLSNAIIKKIIFNPFKLRKVSDTITRALDSKDIQLYFTNQNLQNLALKNGWAGQWPNQTPATSPTSARTLKCGISGDFLAINEANLGGMKSDRYITRDITYHVKFSEALLNKSTYAEAPQADLSVEIHHYGIENIPLSGPYTGYFRLYSCPNQVDTALATDAPGVKEDRPTEELIKLQPGESKTITRSYPLTTDVLSSNREYSLYLAKQSGTQADHYRVIIELPRGYRIESDQFQSRENFAYWDGQLNTDKKLTLKILDDELPPRLVLQENRELNKISLHFNEDLNQNYASDPFSYAVTDLNLKHPEKTDDIRIRKVITTSKDVDIFLTGQTDQLEERYGVTLKNLRDTHGNILSERQITVVQRLD